MFSPHQRVQDAVGIQVVRVPAQDIVAVGAVVLVQAHRPSRRADQVDDQIGQVRVGQVEVDRDRGQAAVHRGGDRAGDALGVVVGNRRARIVVQLDGLHVRQFEIQPGDLLLLGHRDRGGGRRPARLRHRERVVSGVETIERITAVGTRSRPGGLPDPGAASRRRCRSHARPRPYRRSTPGPPRARPASAPRCAAGHASSPVRARRSRRRRKRSGPRPAASRGPKQTTLASAQELVHEPAVTASAVGVTASAEPAPRGIELERRRQRVRIPHHRMQGLVHAHIAWLVRHPGRDVQHLACELAVGDLVMSHVTALDQQLAPGPPHGLPDRS